MIIAAAQTIPHKEDTISNIKDHICLIEKAADHGARLVLFPEMSLTGYEREIANDLAFSPDDFRLDVLRELAVHKNITIIAGAPIKLESGLHIGSFILSPDNSISIYTKQFLHPGEEEFFISDGGCNPQIKVDDFSISHAICYDIENPQHPENAAKNGTTLYTAGIFYSSKGMNEAHMLLSGYAKQFSMMVLMSNFSGECWNIHAGGQSACWDASGELIGKLESEGEGLLLVKQKNEKWISKTI